MGGVAGIDVRRWLTEQGLGQYADAFAAQEIGADVLPELTDADLQSLGVALLGHRKRMLKAIADLGANGERAGSSAGAAAPAPLAAQPAGTSPRAPAGETLEPTSRAPSQVATSSPTTSMMPTPSAASSSTAAAAARASFPVPHASAGTAAERRQVTVVFCDLVGSTQLATQLDPEDLRDLLGVYRDAISRVARQFNGYVAQHLGDGALIYFGYPLAREDDAEQAVRAGLALVTTIEAIHAHGERLRGRVGIATGLVVIGDILPAGERTERGIVGETPNLAARLQALAEPGGVVVSDTTHALVRGIFEYARVAERTLKGFDKALGAWSVLGEKHDGDRFAALRSPHLPLVGRDEELQLLVRRWQAACKGEGKVVLLSGEPGIGKSRLLAALQSSTHADGATLVRCFCSPHHAASALHPVTMHLQQAAGIAASHAPEDKRRALHDYFGERMRPDELELIGELLSLPRAPGAPDAPIVDADPRKRKERTLAALLEHFRELARRGPVQMLVEDVHWIDPSSQELLDCLVSEAPTLSMLLVITHRPEYTAPWTGQAHVSSVALSRLDRQHNEDLIRHVAGAARLPRELVSQIVARTDGVPLFVEELTKTVLETRERMSATAHGDAGLVEVTVPATLQAALMARLDRLATVRAVAQIGAAIGRHFSYELLAAIAEQPPGTLEAALAQLESSEIVFARGRPPDASYTFKHALVQDAAYDSLLKSQRTALHLRIAHVLETRFASETPPEMLAHHYTAAGEGARAIPHWVQAARNALVRGAFAEACAQARRACTLVHAIDAQAPGRERLLLDASLTLGEALMHSGDTLAAVRTLDEAAAAARRLGDTNALVHAALNTAEATWRPGLGIDTPVRLLRDADAALDEGECELKVRVLGRLSVALDLVGEQPEAERVWERAKTYAAALGDSPDVVRTLSRRMLLGFQWHAHELLDGGIDRVLDAVQVCRARGDDSAAAEMWVNIIPALAMVGRMDSLQALVRYVSAYAQETREPWYRYVSFIADAGLQFYLGHFALAESRSHEGLKLGSAELSGFDTAGAYSVQMFSIKRERGQMRAVAPMLRQLLQQKDAAALWRPGLAAVFAELDMLDDAREQLHVLAGDDFGAIPRDASWLNCMTMLAEVCHKLGDVERAAALYERLLPFEPFNVQAAPLLACYGAVSRFLGLLCTAMRRWERAQRHFEAALAQDTAQGGRPWVAHAQHAYAAMLLERDHAGDATHAMELNAAAIATAQSLGMESLVARAQVLHERLTE